VLLTAIRARNLARDQDDTMSDPIHTRARVLIITGLAINVVAAFIDLINIYGDGEYKFLGFSGTFGIFLGPLTALSAAGAWWFLSKITPESSAQRSLLEKALYWFALEALLGVGDLVNVGWRTSAASWSGSIVWIMALGGATEVVGLVMLARSFTISPSPERESQGLPIH
jgi:hypothetical protein